MSPIAPPLKAPAAGPPPWGTEIRATLHLAVPLVLTQLAYMAIVTTDIVMMGWLGPTPLAAGVLAGHFYGFFEFFALGVLAAVAPVLAQHLGARRFRRVRGAFRQGLWMATLLALPGAAIVWHAAPLLVLLGQDPELSAAAQSYLRWMLLGLLQALWQMVLSELLAAHARPRAALVVSVLGIGLNALADYALMFGNFGLPRLELDGAGIASAISNSFMCCALLGFVMSDRRLRRYHLFGRFWRPDPQQFFEILRVGLPIAVAQLAETGMFLASTLLMGLLGTTALAAHAIAAQCCAVVFMVPLGVGQAATVRVGRAGWTAIATALAFAGLPALLFWFLGAEIIGLYLDSDRPENRATIALGLQLLAVAALFQFADSAQVTAMGALRGLKDTRWPMAVALAGYWGVGLGLAAFLGIELELGGTAIWSSFAVALGLVGAALLWRFHHNTRAAAPLGR